MNNTDCYHNHPQKVENPKFFRMIEPCDFGESSSYQCKHCNHIYSFDFDSVAGIKFEDKYEKINIKQEQ